MAYEKPLSERLGDYFIVAFLVTAALSCIVPVINILAYSFSSSLAVTQNRVFLWPVELSILSYKKLFYNDELFLRSFVNSIVRVAVGSSIQMVLIILIGYPLSKESTTFKMRTFYVWFLYFPHIIGTSLIPMYLLIMKLRLMNSIWALVLPPSVAMFSVIILMNFIRRLPRSIEESAYLDGAGYLRTAFSIVVPMSKPCIATLLLFSIVYHWNAWFDGILYITDFNKIPLQTYLQSINLSLEIQWGISVEMSEEEAQIYAKVSNLTLKSARLFVTMVPVLCVYPFLQKYFTKGLIIGSVKQ